MIIVNVEKLREGMQLAEDVCTTTAKEYKVLLKKGMFLSSQMINVMKEKGIKSAKIVSGGLEDAETPVNLSSAAFSISALSASP